MGGDERFGGRGGAFGGGGGEGEVGAQLRGIKNGEEGRRWGLFLKTLPVN